ncbi:MAG: hypothetical protein ACOCR1_03125 [Planctomycetota bacterium]
MGIGQRNASQDTKPDKSKWMWYSCGGCVGLAIAGLVGLGVLFYFLVRAQPVLPPDTFFQSDVDGLMVLQLRPEHDALGELIRDLAEDPPQSLNLSEEEREQLQTQADQIPENLNDVAPLQLVLLAKHLKEASDTIEIVQMTDMEMVEKLTAGPGDKKRFSFAGAASVKPYSGFLRWVVSGIIQSFEEEGGESETYEDVIIGRSPNNTHYLSAVENNFFFAEDRQRITDWIDTVHGQADRDEEDSSATGTFTGPDRLKSLYNRLDTEHPVLFAMDNSDGQLEDLLTTLEEVDADEAQNGVPSLTKVLSGLVKSIGLDSSDVQAAGGTFTVASADTGEISLVAECTNQEAAGRIADDFTGAIREAYGEGEDVNVSDESEDGIMILRITVRNLQSAIRSVQ